jgi:hypothetical protein
LQPQVPHGIATVIMVMTTLSLRTARGRCLALGVRRCPGQNRRSQPGQPTCAPPGVPPRPWEVARQTGSCTVRLRPLVNPLRRPDFPAHLTSAYPQTMFADSLLTTPGRRPALVVACWRFGLPESYCLRGRSATGTAWEGTSDDAAGEQCSCQAFHLLTCSSTASMTSATRDTTSLRWPRVIR